MGWADGSYPQCYETFSGVLAPPRAPAAAAAAVPFPWERSGRAGILVRQ